MEVDVRTRILDHSGQTYNGIYVMSKTSKMTGHNAVYNVRCHCHNVYQVGSHNIRRTKSCGCLLVSHPNYIKRRDHRQSYRWIRERNKRHGGKVISYTQYVALCTSDCRYCGSPPANQKSANGLLYQGIDRLESTIGYVDGNCVPCCWPCNRGKWKDTEQEYIDHCLAVVRHSLLLDI